MHVFVTARIILNVPLKYQSTYVCIYMSLYMRPDQLYVITKVYSLGQMYFNKYVQVCV